MEISYHRNGATLSVDHEELDLIHWGLKVSKVEDLAWDYEKVVELITQLDERR